MLVVRTPAPGARKSTPGPNADQLVLLSEESEAPTMITLSSRLNWWFSELLPPDQTSSEPRLRM